MKLIFTTVLDNSHDIFFGTPPVPPSMNMEDGAPMQMEDGTLIESET